MPGQKDTKVVKRVGKASEQLNAASFQETQACNDNLNRQLESYIKAFDKLENCLTEMSVTVELGISLANSLGKDDARGQSYLESLSKYSGYIAKSKEDIEVTSDQVEEMRKHAIEVLSTREEEKEKALDENAEKKFRANESFWTGIPRSLAEIGGPQRKGKETSKTAEVSNQRPSLSTLPQRTWKCGPPMPDFTHARATWTC